MFSYQKPTNYKDFDPGGHFRWIKYKDETGFSITLCLRQHWSLGGCGTAALQKFSRSSFWNERKNIDALIEFLHEPLPDIDEWQMDEFLFTLTNLQLPRYAALVEHPLVKQIDQWTNKAHGPSDICLFRLSIQGDWKWNKAST